MINAFSRTDLLIGEENRVKLNNSKVLVFGIGGVGGFAVEALARTGVGEIHLVDSDVISITNINRQIIADTETVGRNKTDVMAERIKKINPDCKVVSKVNFFLPENADEFDFSYFDYIVDAVDTVTAKIAIAVKANECGTPLISSMGTGNKLDPTAFKVADIYKTRVCPLAKVMRRELKKRSISRLKVVYSEEEPKKPAMSEEKTSKRTVPASIAFVPSVAGLIIASEVIKDLIKLKGGTL